VSRRGQPSGAGSLGPREFGIPWSVAARPSSAAERPAGRDARRETKRGEMLLLAALSLLLSVAAVLLGMRGEGVGDLGAYFDGHLYIEIARSFPLPYSPDGRDYLGHAPGFAALLSLARLLTPDALHWGALALGVTWLSAVAAVLAFYLLCAELDVTPLPASLAFLLANPAWILVSSAPHPEPLAAALALLCFVAYLRGSLPWAVAWLALATLTRFPALLLGGALAFDLLFVRRDWRPRTFAWLSVPLAVFGLFQAYLYWRVPGFTGVWDVHQVHWVSHWTYPFEAMLRYWPLMSERGLFQGPIIYTTVSFYLAATLAGFRPSERHRWWLAVWCGLVLLLHVSMSGTPGVESFTRLALLCWPPALLITWRCLPRRALRRPLALAAAVALAGLGGLGFWVSFQQIRVAVFVQSHTLWIPRKVAALRSDEPRWVDFKEMRDIDRVRLQQRRKRERLRAERTGNGSN